MNNILINSTDIRELAAEIILNADRKQIIRIMNEEFGIALRWNDAYNCFEIPKETAKDYNLETEIE